MVDNSNSLENLTLVLSRKAWSGMQILQSPSSSNHSCHTLQTTASVQSIWAVTWQQRSTTSHSVTNLACSKKVTGMGWGKTSHMVSGDALHSTLLAKSCGHCQFFLMLDSSCQSAALADNFLRHTRSSKLLLKNTLWPCFYLPSYKERHHRISWSFSLTAHPF